MNNSRPSRRQFLGATGAGLAGILAGCVEPGSNPTFSVDTTEPFEYDGDAPGTTYTDVYEATIDSVAQVRVFGRGGDDFADGGMGQGSAFQYDSTHVITNEHVVGDGADIDLQYGTGDWSETTVVGTDVYSDLAVLEVDRVPQAATPLELSDERPVPGMEVLAIGNPFGLEGTMSQGIVSGVNRSLNLPDRAFSFPNVVQTDAAVNPGSSGGPLVDLDGSVVGIVHAGGGVNIGFAISAALAQRVVPTLITDGEYHHSYMGVTIGQVDRLVAEENDLPEATGIIIVDVDPDGPTADGPLHGSDDSLERHGEQIPIGGDVIIAIDDEPIPDLHALSTYLALETSPGDTISITVWRDGEETTVELTLGQRPSPS